MTFEDVVTVSIIIGFFLAAYWLADMLINRDDQ